MPVYTGNNPMVLAHIIHGETDTGFLATGYFPQITGLLNSGDAADMAIIKNHVGRELFRKLYNNGLSNLITDDYDAGFRPETVTGMYS